MREQTPQKDDEFPFVFTVDESGVSIFSLQTPRNDYSFTNIYYMESFVKGILTVLLAQFWLQSCKKQCLQKFNVYLHVGIIIQNNTNNN